MKKVILAAVLATMAGTPAFAQSYNPGYGTGNIAPNVTQANPDGVFRYPVKNSRRVTTTHSARAAQSGHAAFAQDMTGSVYPAATSREFYKGTDPDPNIRAELRREEQEGW
jgi:hypothetical protein